MVTPETTTSVATLETPRLWLRGPSLGDVPAYQRHFADYEVIRHLSAAVPWPYPEDGVEQWLRNVVLPAQGQDRWTWGRLASTLTPSVLFPFPSVPPKKTD